MAIKAYPNKSDLVKLKRMEEDGANAKAIATKLKIDVSGVEAHMTKKKKTTKKTEVNEDML